MIDGKTIKSLYDDKPTLLEWLKRVEEQLEELKKVTNFDTLTANNVEVNQDLDVGGMLIGHGADFQEAVHFQNGASVMNDFYVNNKALCRNIYVHQITWDYMGDKVTKKYLSTKSTPYSSMADVFAHKNDTDLSTSEVVEYVDESAIFKFDSTGRVLSAVEIGVTGNGDVRTSAMAADTLEFAKDEVIGGWAA